jgi:hypothetical protein
MPQAFEWVVQDVGKLRDFVERRGLDETTDGSAGSDRDDFEILKSLPCLEMENTRYETRLTLPLRWLKKYSSARTRSDAEHKSSLCNVSYAGLQRRVLELSNLSNYVGCDQVSRRSYRGARCEGRLGMGRLAK